MLQVEQRRRQQKFHYQMIISEDEFGSCLQTVAVFLYWKFCPFCNFIPGLKQFLLALQVAGKGQCSLLQTGLLHLFFLQQQIYGHTKNAEAGGEIRSMGGSQTSLVSLSTLWYILQHTELILWSHSWTMPMQGSLWSWHLWGLAYCWTRGCVNKSFLNGQD